MSDPPCDECGKPVVANVDARYSVADKWDDDGNLISSRHRKCHIPLEVAIDNLREKIANVEKATKAFNDALPDDRPTRRGGIRPVRR